MTRDHRLAMLFMAISMLILPLMDAYAKMAGEQAPPAQIAGMRFVVQGLIGLAALKLWPEKPPFLPRRPMLMSLASALILVATSCFFWALQTMPLANTLAVFFAQPFILILASSLFLGEHLTGRRVAAVALGFAGALIVLRPNVAAYGVTAALPLVSAACYAAYMLLTKTQAAHEHPGTLMAWAGVSNGALAALVLAAGAAAGVQDLTPVMGDSRLWALFLAIGIISALGHGLIVMALRRAPANMLAPLNYLEIISGVFFGWWFFGDLVDLWTGVGICVILGAGMLALKSGGAKPS